MQNKKTKSKDNSEVTPIQKITRQEALKKMGKYAALASLGTYILLNPKKAQAQSPADPGTDFKVGGDFKLF